ncbi:hypothetical protein [Exiguobacterium artemiae]
MGEFSLNLVKDIPSCETDGAMFSQAARSFPIAVASFHDFRLAHQIDESIPLSEYAETIELCKRLALHNFV